MVLGTCAVVACDEQIEFVVEYVMEVLHLGSLRVHIAIELDVDSPVPA
jgi:hypothetical protein